MQPNGSRGTTSFQAKVQLPLAECLLLVGVALMCVVLTVLYAIFAYPFDPDVSKPLEMMRRHEKENGRFAEYLSRLPAFSRLFVQFVCGWVGVAIMFIAIIVELARQFPDEEHSILYWAEPYARLVSHNFGHAGLEILTVAFTPSKMLREHEQHLRFHTWDRFFDLAPFAKESLVVRGRWLDFYYQAD